jgi:hypothetical protein
MQRSVPIGHGRIAESRKGSLAASFARRSLAMLEEGSWRGSLEGPLTSFTHGAITFLALGIGGSEESVG